LMKEQAENVKAVQPTLLRIGLFSLAMNLVLAGGKMGMSLITGSLALRADAIHSGVDVLGSLALIIGLLISNRKSKNFPYGLYKVENVVAVIISLLLFLAAYEIISEAFSRSEAVVEYPWWVLLVVGLVVLAPFLFSRYEASVGKRWHSPSLVADAGHFKADVLSSLVVFFGLVGQRLGFPLDRVAAAIVALFIGYAAWGLLATSMRVLLDASIGRDMLDQIRSLVEAEPAVAVVKSIAGRNSGRYVFVEVDVTLRLPDLKRAHQISERIEGSIKSAVPNVDTVLVHYAPQDKTWFRYAVALAARSGEVSEHFGESPYFAIVDIDAATRLVRRQEMVANPYAGLEKGKGIKVAQLLLTYKPDFVVCRDSLSGKGPGYAFAEAGTQAVQTEARCLDDFLAQLTHSPA